MFTLFAILFSSFQLIKPPCLNFRILTVFFGCPNIYEIHGNATLCPHHEIALKTMFKDQNGQDSRKRIISSPGTGAI